MMNLCELRARIESVNSTKKITKAQEPITTLRTAKAQRRAADPQPYADETGEVIGCLASASSLGHPMLVKREGNQRVAVLVVISDHGMCGGYNHNVLKKAAELRTALEEQGYEVVLYVTDCKGTDYYDFRGAELAGTWEGSSQDPDYAATHDVRRYFVDSLNATAEGTAKYREGLRDINGEAVQGFDQVHVVYTESVFILSQIPCAYQMLPIEPMCEDVEIAQGEDMLSDGSDDLKPDYEFEPDVDTLLVEPLPRYAFCTLSAVMLEVVASKSATRCNAMKSVTDNATELAKGFSRVTNQARQVQTIQETTEIAGGAGALDDSGESD